MSELVTEHELDLAAMKSLAEGHDAALNELMDRHGPKLFHYLIRCLQSEEDAADATQEAFVRVYQNRAKFDPGQQFSTWLYTIATNLARDCYRHRARHPQISLEAEDAQTGGTLLQHLTDANPTPDESLRSAERSEAVRRAIAQLPDELRTPLVLSEYEERSHAEIGAILHCSAKAVETRLYRARNLLREQLAGYF